MDIQGTLIRSDEQSFVVDVINRLQATRVEEHRGS